MKKALCVLFAALLLCGAALAEAAEAPEALSSASVNNYYGSMTGDELMNAINASAGFYAVASVNPDGTPNIGFFIYHMVALDGRYYLQLGLAPNQTTANVENGSQLVAMYAAAPGEDPAYATNGARMLLQKVEDEAILAELLKTAPQGFAPMYYEVVETKPLG